MEDLEPMEVTELTHRNEENNQVRDNGRLKYRGLAIIAIFRQFKQEEMDIYYTEEDRKLLERGFSKLQYGVLVWDDPMMKKTFFRRLQKVSCDPINNECETFALVIITHGDENGTLHAFDGPFSRQDVYNCFKAEECLQLKDKMKFFIFHACRGSTYGEGVQADGNPKKNKIQDEKLKDHVEKDYLILCSTFEGCVAFAPEENIGSIFIRALSSSMEEAARRNEGERKHILAILTDVIRKTANEDIHVKGVIKKQQPTLVMTLHQLYYFKNKNEIPKECLQILSKSAFQLPLSE